MKYNSKVNNHNLPVAIMDSSRSQKEKMERAKEVISNILEEEKEYKLRELDIINEKLQQTEEQLDKLRQVNKSGYCLP